MANGRHARGAEHPAAQLDPGPQVPQDQEALAGKPAPSGRRRKSAAEQSVPASAPVESLRQVAVAPPTDLPTGTGRRRRTGGETPPPAALPAPSGHRRRAAPPVAPAAPVALQPPTGRRRATGTPKPADAFRSDAAPRAGAGATQAPTILAPIAAREIADVVELAPRSHRRAAAPTTGRAAKAGGHAARTGGHAAGRRKALLPAGAPSSTALIAGAAAVAVAAVGAVGAANSGSELGATSVEMSRAASLGLAGAPVTAGLVDVATADREQARASRERARDALADRARVAAQIKKKEAAAARAVAAAKARAKRLEQLSRSFRIPVNGYRLTAYFGESSYRWSNGHTGLDFACSYGTPIRAVANGTVVSAGWDGSYGYKTVIRHADGTETWYAHQSQILVRRGVVAAGQIIGRVGSTGNSSGSHLHLEVRINDVPINPLAWLRSRGLRP